MLTKGQIKESFKLHNSLPLGIDNVLLELVKRAHLIPLEDLKSRKFYQSKKEKAGWLKWLLKGAYKYTIGWLWKTNMEIPENTPLVSISYLNVLSFPII